MQYGAAYGALPTPSASGYRFLGWFTHPTGGSQVSQYSTMGACNTTLYAHWQQLVLKSEKIKINLYAVSTYYTVTPSTISQITSAEIVSSGCVFGIDSSSWANCSCYTDGSHVYVRLDSYDTSKCTIPNDRAVCEIMIKGY